jgi:AraC family transcriptional regulator, transcriptional activator FtrA
MRKRLDRSRVAVVALPGTPIFELAVPCEVFGIDRSDLAAGWYDFGIHSAASGVSLAHGFGVPAGLDLTDLSGAGTVLVPGCRSIHDGAPAELLAALRVAHDQGARIAGICSGAFVLAQAGLLDGLRATTHWMHASELARRFPTVTVDADVLYVQQDRIWTSAGTAAAIDLCLELVRRDHGAAIANEVARRMVTPPHRGGGQAQYIRTTSVTPHGDPLADTLAWARANLDRELSIVELADRAGMSHRTLIRRFRTTTHTTPQQWLARERIMAAQQLLETTTLPIDRVAQRSGHGSAANLRLQFQRHVGVTPSAYRATFNSTNPDSANPPNSTSNGT